MNKFLFSLVISFSIQGLAYAPNAIDTSNRINPNLQQVAGGCSYNLPVDLYYACLDRLREEGYRWSSLRIHIKQHPQFAASGCAQYINENDFWDCFRREVLQLSAAEPNANPQQVPIVHGEYGREVNSNL